MFDWILNTPLKIIKGIDFSKSMILTYARKNKRSEILDKNWAKRIC